MQKMVLSGVSIGAIISGIIAHIAFTVHGLLSYPTTLLLTVIFGLIHGVFLAAVFNTQAIKWKKLLIITAFGALLFRLAGFVQTYHAGELSLYFFYGTLFIFLIGLLLTITAYVVPDVSAKE